MSSEQSCEATFEGRQVVDIEEERTRGGTEKEEKEGSESGASTRLREGKESQIAPVGVS